MEFTLLDFLNKTDIDIDSVKLIRHALNNDKCKKCIEKGYFEEYNAHQLSDFSQIGDYWFVFTSGVKTSAVLYKVYKVVGKIKDCEYEFPADYPDLTDKDCSMYKLEESEYFKEYNNRLVIEWGKSTVSWVQRRLDKKIIAIKDNIKEFDGYEYFVLSFDEMSEMIHNPELYYNWYVALTKINAVYLIVDKESGKQYAGSSYGNKGLWGRWESYAQNHHGGNKGLIELLEKHPHRYKSFSFTILQILSKNVSEEQAVAIENKWKNKLFSKEHGLNQN